MRDQAEWKLMAHFAPPKDVTLQVYSDAYKWMGTDGVMRGYFHSDYNGHKDVMTLDGRGGHPPRDKATHWMLLPAPPESA